MKIKTTLMIALAVAFIIVIGIAYIQITVLNASPIGIILSSLDWLMKTMIVAIVLFFLLMAFPHLKQLLR